jgi:hypothetical protein
MVEIAYYSKEQAGLKTIPIRITLMVNVCQALKLLM